MPKDVVPWTDMQVRKKQDDGYYAVGGVRGLYLKIANGRKNWFFKYTVQGKTTEISVGSYPIYSLKKAREKVMEYRELLSEGKDPKQYKREQKKFLIDQINQKRRDQYNFEKAFSDYLVYRDQTDPMQIRDKADLIARIEKYVIPYIGKKPINEIAPKDIAKLLSSLYPDHVALAKKIRSSVRQVFSWLKAKGELVIEIPVDVQVLQHLLPKTPVLNNRHHAMLEVRVIPTFMADLSRRYSSSAKCLEFAILTASRAGNAIFAEWSEIDFEKKLWTIPANKMKVARNGDHKVPLSEQAIKILNFMKSVCPQRRYIFPGPGGSQHLSDGAFGSLIRKMNLQAENNGTASYRDRKQKNRKGQLAVATPHGIARASFRTWAQDDELGNDRRFNEKVAELCLHHDVSDNYGGAYNRNEAMRSRREMMQAWADYCYSKENEK